ncbi:DUF2934 domain-containing protein [Mesorhizobium sp. BR1-1-16]|uniref:DUF2934 domain-containing protein n=1 Tax=Mesorhizobium sp. BR1-1-16 TaxID=2876653 RepID=UPI001CCB1A50|nr:DUF2934 domain-containing protein [Mesorhizobium sp. BR1-1-16]MBZ9936981.1 DUF2934 domain-containing protein [Mesorhizobium sp. BR1-1-16]
MDEHLSDRIRRKAYELWEAEGRPEGRAQLHWDEAKEIIAVEDVGEPTMSIEESARIPVEPALAFENQADVPGLDDQGDSAPGPSRDALERPSPIPLATDLKR